MAKRGQLSAAQPDDDGAQDFPPRVSGQALLSARYRALHARLLPLIS